jgi:hypothetical protein
MKQHVSSETDFPTEKHWAIVKFTMVHIPGDERSRFVPGHGYLAHSEAVIKYEAFETKAAWVAAIQAIEDGNAKGRRIRYRALVVEPKEVTTKIQVSI